MKNPPLTRGERVRHDSVTMKTVTVRDLKNRFADVAKGIDHGEVVTITRCGTAFATLTPAKVRKPSKAFIAKHYKERKPVEKGMSKEAIEKLWSDLRD